MSEWKKRGSCRDFNEYAKELTGLSLTEIRNGDQKNYSIKNLEKAAQVIMWASKNSKKIVAVGDYDSDGINSLAILSTLFKALKIKYSLSIPKRISEGYGLSPAIIERNLDADILITIDNGIKAMEAIRIAKNNGIYVIVLDHHTADLDADGNPTLPPADIIIDPEALPDGCGFTHYCGAGIAYKLSALILGENHPLMEAISAYAAVGTIGDAVAMLGDNRIITTRGMDALKNGRCSVGLAMLAESCKINKGSSATDFAFNLVPCLNAPGRLYDDGSKLALKTIFCSNYEKATQYVDAITKVNLERRNIVAKYISEMNIEAMRTNDEHCIFYQNKDIPEGIVGIIAGQISEKTGKPAFAMTEVSPGIWKGSARSRLKDTSLIDVMSKYDNMFVKFGGHKQAAAFTVRENDIQKLKNFLEIEFPIEPADNSIFYDFEVAEDKVEATGSQILSMEPFGKEFEEPVVKVHARLDKSHGDGYQLMGEKKNHIKLKCKGFDAVGFYMSDKLTDPHKGEYDLIGTFSWNVWRDKKTLTLNLLDFV